MDFKSDYKEYRKWLDKLNKDSKCTSDMRTKMFLDPMMSSPLVKSIIGSKLISTGIFDGDYAKYFEYK